METMIKDIFDNFQWKYKDEITIYVLLNFNNRRIC